MISALLLFVIALAATGIALALVTSHSGYVTNLLDALKLSTEKVFEEDLQVVYTAANRNGMVIIGVMNAGTTPIRILALYLNGSPVQPSSMSITCREGEIRSLPVTMSGGDLCLVTISTKVKGRYYIVTIATEGSSYSVKVYT